MNAMLSGVDVLLADAPHWKTSRIGLVTNHAACTADFQPARQALLAAGFNITRLFSPEHGLDTIGVDGAAMKDGTDPLTGLPVTSLYGGKLAPDEQDLAEVDLVLFDIPDIGCRFYTYLWTMTHVMEACALHGKHLVIADRPNPLSGRLDLAEGPLLDERHCSSFIGRWNMPLRHSCTLGELALYFKATAGSSILRTNAFRMEVVRCANWQRTMFYPQWRHSFVPTSPAIPCFESALLYPGLGLLEATNISEGRGTATPFRIAGAPWMDGAGVAARINMEHPGGVYARPVTFKPTEGKYAGQKCDGVMLHVQDPAVFRPVRYGWLLICIIKKLHPGFFAWASYPTYVNHTGARHLDLLTGVQEAESLVAVTGDNIDDISRYTGAGDWPAWVAPYLLY
ncbi:exo-beta-N-acetylmuramidase NamZ family protein [Chitinophaga sp. 22536]|uniref:exo-beta-N-acetylmuramidase NamZ family protein n=1 Tax=unclassified Chitinophaga TaxID=2619133 RepID=UPI003F858726